MAIGPLWNKLTSATAKKEEPVNPAKGKSPPAPSVIRTNDDTGRRFVGIGHSHLGAYIHTWMGRHRAGETNGDSITLIRLIHDDFQPNFETIDGVHQLSPAMIRRVRFILKRDAPVAIFCALMGNEYNMLAMAPHPEGRYDFDYPARPGHPAEAMDPAARRVSFAAIRAELAATAAANTLMIWRAIAAAVDCPIFLLPPPPPIGDNDFIRDNPDVFGDVARRHGLNPPEMRRRMWRLFCEALREGVAGSGTTFVELPDEVFEDGFLAKRFWLGDATHANPKYGKVMLAHLESLGLGAETASVEGVPPAAPNGESR